MRELILKILKTMLIQYPEIRGHLTGTAAKVVEDGIERHQRIPPHHEGIYIYTPGKTELTQKDIDKAVKEWDKLMPEYAGMLDAKVEIDKNAE